MTLLREAISVAEMKEDPELAKKMLGMRGPELLEFYAATAIETHTTISYNDRIPEGETCEPVERAEEKLAQVKAYTLLRMGN